MTTVTIDNITLEILPDECPENPRDWDHLGTMACWHRRYALGDRHGYHDPEAFSRDIHAGNAVILPLYLLDHSGITISTDPAPFSAYDPAGWDWGQVGFAYATLDDIRREFGVGRVSRRVRAQAAEVLRGEVAAYDQYLRGEVYGFVLTDNSTGVVIDSCWGFFGGDFLTNGMTDHFPAEFRGEILSRLRQRAA